jgi:hypothetical protein
MSLERLERRRLTFIIQLMIVAIKTESLERGISGQVAGPVLSTSRKENPMAAKQGGNSGGGKSRSAKTGEYVKPEYAKKHPATTVVEKDQPKKK